MILILIDYVEIDNVLSKMCKFEFCLEMLNPGHSRRFGD